MAYKDLTFLLFAKDMSASRGFEKVAASADGMSAGVAGALATAGVAVAGLSIAVGAESVKMAANFQTATDRLVTDAGESAANLGKVREGILNLSADTGVSAEKLATGMYTVESAGYHGAQGLQVLKAATEGAVIGMADLGTVANALTTTMTDWNIPTSKSVSTMNALISIVSHGKTTMEDLAGSIHSVAPTAAALGITLAQTGGAIATMTAEGISADQATENLNHTITSLAAPTSVMRSEMAAMGLNSTTVAEQLGSRGLTGTLNELVNAITNHMGPAGLVIQKSFNQSQTDAQSADVALKGLSGRALTLADAYRDGTISLGVWRTAVKTLTPEQANQVKQFASLEDRARGFSTLLKSGGGNAQTFTAALEKMTGGQTGLSVALHLTGDHMPAFQANVKSVGKAAAQNGKDVDGWALKQKELNQKLAEAGTTFQRVGIEIGTSLIPALEELLPDIKKVGDAAANARPIFDALGRVIGFTIENSSLVMFSNFKDAIQALNNPVQGVSDALRGKFGPAVQFAAGTGKILGDVFAAIGKWGHDTYELLNGYEGDFFKIGGDLIQGLVNGIQARGADMIGAVSNIVSGAISTAKSILGIQSPSKVFFGVGSDTMKGFENGVISRASTSKATVSKVVAGAISAAQAIVAGNAGIENSAFSVNDMTSARKDVISQTRSSTIDAGNIVSYDSPGSAIQNLQMLVANTRRFKSDLGKLSKMGVDDSTFMQLVNGWQSDPATALRVADQLVGNPMDLKQIVALQNQLSLAGTQLGMAESSAYGSRISAGQRSIARTEKGMHLDLHLHLQGTYAGSKDDLAKTIMNAFRDAVKRGIIPKNALATI